MCYLLEARRVNEIPVDSMEWSPSFLGLGWDASVFQGVTLVREARSTHGLEKDKTMTHQGR
jgi:hypothetical protein